jgi:uncharacterized SAM-binding protein YcdF (DUF218 family)
MHHIKATLFMAPSVENAAGMEGVAPYILPSGVSTLNLETTEWEFLRDIGIELGVPENAILRADKATNTFENSRFSKHVLQQMGIHPTRAIFVCKSYHARRGLLT